MLALKIKAIRRRSILLTFDNDSTSVIAKVALTIRSTTAIMARKKIDIWATPANPQADCRLLGLIAEIRNTVWEFTLSVEPDLNSTVYFTKPRYVPADNST